MATYSEVTIKFTNDWVVDDQLGYSTNQMDQSVAFRWVATRTESYKVTEGTPTANVGETSAINFKAAFDLDFPTGYVTTIQNTNEVLIQAENPLEIFYSVIVISGQGTATITINNIEVDETKINIRSPYFISVSDTDLTKVDMEIYVYDGVSSDEMNGLTYSLSNTSINNEVVFEISHLISDYLDVNFSGTYDSRVVWANITTRKYISGVPQYATIKRYLAFDGYGYFEESANPVLSEKLLQTNNTMYVLDNNYFYIPIQQDYLSQVDLKSNGVVVDTQTFTATTDSSDVIRYIGYTNDSICNAIVNYLFEDNNDYLFQDSNTFVFNTGVDIVDEILITYSDATTETVYIKTITENKHTPYRLTFVNKFGALQSVWMFKRSDLSMDIDRSEYRAYTFNNSTTSYDTAEHQYKNLYVSGKQSLRLNSGFYPESHNNIFRELLLSEKVWIHYDSELLPVNIKTNNISYKTSVNDKLINYSIDFDFAFDTINSVY